MDWNHRFGADVTPTAADIRRFIESPLWEELCSYLERAYRVEPSLSYSRCGMAPGWNIKYRKGGKSLCTLYPAPGYFTCLVVIGEKEAAEAELLMKELDPHLQALYHAAQASAMGRWLMIKVTTPRILENTKSLISLRKRPEV